MKHQNDVIAAKSNSMYPVFTESTTKDGQTKYSTPMQACSLFYSQMFMEMTLNISYELCLFVHFYALLVTSGENVDNTFQWISYNTDLVEHIICLSSCEIHTLILSFMKQAYVRVAHV